MSGAARNYTVVSHDSRNSDSITRLVPRVIRSLVPQEVEADSAVGRSADGGCQPSPHRPCMPSGPVCGERGHPHIEPPPLEPSDRCTRHPSLTRLRRPRLTQEANSTHSSHDAALRAVGAPLPLAHPRRPRAECLRHAHRHTISTAPACRSQRRAASSRCPSNASQGRGRCLSLSTSRVRASHARTEPSALRTSDTISPATHHFLRPHAAPS
jgi:hypothetical protein